MRPRSLSHALFAMLALTSFGPACGGDEAGSDKDTFPSDILITSETSTSKPPDGSGGNHAPELERIGNRTVGLGKTLVIALAAKDADSDPLTYSVFGAMPPGARFDKEAARFEWTPQDAGHTVFLTFVVSDGLEFDRETVQIDVTNGGETHPPEFVKVGDQVAVVGTPFELKLEATDADGDALTFGHDGELPTGATLDAATGVFRWTATADQAGSPVRITFTVSDGTASATLAVRFVVDDGGSATAKPPVFGPLAAATATANVAFGLDLGATDPNGDPVTFQMVSGAPAGAILQGAHFTWTPSSDDIGRTYQVGFSASDGALTTLATLPLNVTSGQTATCSDDAYEPNETLGAAKPLAAGSHTAGLCDSAAKIDVDYYALTVPAGQGVTATLNFTDDEADLDLYLFANGVEVASSEGWTGTEEISFATGNTPGPYVLEVVGYGFEYLALEYTLAVDYGTIAVCEDDQFEQNDTPATAKPLSAVGDTTVQMCANDTDFWSLEVACGQHVEVLLESTQDIDLYLYDNANADGAPVASAATEELFEDLDLLKAPRAGTYILEITGFPPASVEASYDMIVDQSGGCTDDAFANGSKATAKTLASGTPVTGGVVCCAEDWYKITASAGDQLALKTTPQGAGASVGMTVLDTNGTTQLAAVEPATGQQSLTATASHAGTFYVRVKGATSSRYDLALIVTAGGGQCTNLSCPSGKVCNGTTGECVADFCFNDDSECPSGHVCRDTYCVNACTGPSDCRDGYSCKTLQGGSFCGLAGDAATGDPCFDHTECADNLGCAFEGSGGYCAQLSCTACPGGTKCASTSEGSMCAKNCVSATDCRGADGYTCTAEKTCLPQD